MCLKEGFISGNRGEWGWVVGGKIKRRELTGNFEVDLEEE